MKRQFVAIVVIFSIGLLANAFQADAQGNKIGYISLQELVAAMPEYKKAQLEMQEYQKALVQQGTDYQQAFINDQKKFIEDSLKMTPAVKEVKRKSLNEMYIKWTNFVNQEAQQMMNQHEQELLAPIQDKAVSTSQAVAKENGYAYILPKEQLIAFPAADDILPLVFKKLNITKEAPAAAGSTAPAAPAKKQ